MKIDSTGSSSADEPVAEPVKDESAAQAIQQLKADEAFEDYDVIWVDPWGGGGGCSPGYPIDPGFTLPDDPGNIDPGFTLPDDPGNIDPGIFGPDYPGCGIYPQPSYPVLVPTFNQLTGQELTGYLLEGVMDKGGELNELQQFQALRNDPSVKPDPAAQRVLDVVDKWVAILQASGQTEMTPEQKAQFAADLSAAAKPRFFDFHILSNDWSTQGEPGPNGLPYPYKG